VCKADLARPTRRRGFRSARIRPPTKPTDRSLRQSVQVRASKRAFRHRLIMRKPARCDRGRVRRTREVRGPTPINVGSDHRRGTRRAPRRTHATSRDHISGTWVHACGGLGAASAASSRRRCRSGCSGTGRWARFRRPLDEACHAVVAVWGADRAVTVTDGRKLKVRLKSRLEGPIGREIPRSPRRSRGDGPRAGL
jgi:hypothetical protein